MPASAWKSSFASKPALRSVPSLLSDRLPPAAKSDDLKSEVPECVQQKNRQEESFRAQIRKFWENVNPSGNPENKRTEQKIDGQNVHGFFLATRLSLRAETQRSRRTLCTLLVPHAQFCSASN